jgi:hypothetical protein
MDQVAGENRPAIARKARRPLAFLENRVVDCGSEQAARFQDARHPEQERRLRTRDSSQQASPGIDHPHLIRDLSQDRGDSFCSREDEPDVDKAAARRFPRRAEGNLAQAIRVGVYPDAEHIGPAPSHAVHPPAVARSDVNDHRGVVLDQVLEGAGAEAFDPPTTNNSDTTLHPSSPPR